MSPEHKVYHLKKILTVVLANIWLSFIGTKICIQNFNIFLIILKVDMPLPMIA